MKITLFEYLSGFDMFKFEGCTHRSDRNLEYFDEFQWVRV